jgi:LPS sulfotransferase NodH
MRARYFDQMVSDAYDRPTEAPPAEIRRVMLCTMPRTAGHTVCDAMRRAGWGIPTEYFMANFALPFQRRWFDAAPADPQALAGPYGEKLLALRTANRIFSAKVFHGDLDFAHAAVGRDHGNWAYIYLHRNDKVSQILSMAAVRKTGRLFDTDAESEFIPLLETIDRRAIEDLFWWITRQEQAWKQYLLRIDPARFISISSEALLADPARVLKTIAARFALPDPGDAIDAGAIRNGRYRTDAAFKQALRERYGDMLARLSKDSP